MSKQTPRVGTGTEIYIFSTVDTPPDAVSEQSGIQADFPEPDAANRTKDRITVGGDWREDNSGVLPVRITVEGIATIERNLERQIARALAGDGTRITDLIRRVRGTLYPSHIGIPVPRFSVQRAGDSSPRGIESDFVDLAEFPPISPPSGYVIVFNEDRASAPSLAVDQFGAVLCAYMIEKDGGDDAGKHKVACVRYDQATDDGWVSLVDETGMDFIGTLNTPQVALLNFRGEIYAIVSDAGTLGSGATGSLYTFRLSIESGTFTLISGPTRIGTAHGLIGNGGLAAAAAGDRVVVAIGCYSSAQIAFREETRTIWIGQSSDLATWSDGVESESGFVALDAFLSSLPAASDGSPTTQQVNRIRFAADKLRGWAVTQSGRIYGTQDGGRTWARQDSPVSVPLHDIIIASGTDDATMLFACGGAGCVLRSVDSGTNWLIVSISRTEQANIDSSRFTVATDASVDDRSRPAIGESVLYGLASDGVSLWVVGENLILRLFDLTAARVSIKTPPLTPPETSGTYTSVALLYPASDAGHADGTALLVGGRIERQRNKAPKDLKRYRFVRITKAENNSYGPGQANHNYTFHDELTPEAHRVEAIARRAWNEAYAIGKGGTLLLSTDLDATTPTWTPVAVPSKRDFASIVYRQGSTAGSHELLLVSADGLLFRSVRSGSDWVLQHIGTEVVGKCVAVVTENVADDEQGVILCGGGKGLWRSDLSAVMEALPSLVALRSGELILATANLDAGMVDIRRSVDRGSTFSRFDLSGEAVVTFTAQEDEVSDIQDPALRPSLLVDEAGQLVVTAGDGGKVSTDGRGDSWVDEDSAKLPLPLGSYPIVDVDTQNRSRQSIAFGGGRYLSVSILADGTIETRLARQWVINAAKPFCPVVPGVPQWIGIDDLRVTFDSLSTPVGESWLIPADYRFPARNLIYDTRVLGWRGSEGSIAPVTMDWNRRSLQSVFLKGAGDAWSFTAGSLFGVNFRRAAWHLSLEAGTEFTDDPTEYLVLPMTSEVESFVLAATPGSTSPYGVLRATNKGWVPACYRPGTRQYFVEVAHSGVSTAYRVLDNTDDALIVERYSGSPAAAQGDAATIYTDRMATVGDQATLAGAPHPPPMGTKWEFPTWVRLFIPDQPTPDGYRKIDSAIMGRHVPVELKLPQGTLPRDRYDAGWRWRPVLPAIEERAASGAVAVAHLGRPLLGWSLAYTAVEWADRDATLTPMLANKRRAFALIFDDADLLTVELVRLASAIPESVHSSGDLHGFGIELEEVG